MGGEDYDVSCLNPVYSAACRRKVRVCGRNEKSDYPGRLSVFDYPLFRYLLDDADAFLSQGVPEDPSYLEPLVHASDGIAKPAFLNAHVDQPLEGLLVCHGPSDGLTQPVDPGLVVSLDHLEGLLCPLNGLVDDTHLFFREFLCHDNIMPPVNIIY